LGRQYRITIEENGLEFSFLKVFQLKEDSRYPGDRLKEIQGILAEKSQEMFGDKVPRITRIEEI
jgi:hypothetical protein